MDKRLMRKIGWELALSMLWGFWTIQYFGDITGPNPRWWHWLMLMISAYFAQKWIRRLHVSVFYIWPNFKNWKIMTKVVNNPEYKVKGRFDP